MAVRKIILGGNGASAVIPTHQSVDYWKTGGMRAIAFNDPALLTSISNNFSCACVSEKPFGVFGDAGHVFAALSNSGRPENILRGARAQGEGVLCLTRSVLDWIAAAAAGLLQKA